MNWELLDIKAEVRKGRGPGESNWQHLLDRGESKGIPEKKKSVSALLIMLVFNHVDHNKL